MKNARTLGVRLDAQDAARLNRFETTTHVDGVTLARLALRAALDRFEAQGNLQLPLIVVEGMAQSVLKNQECAAPIAVSPATSPGQSQGRKTASIVKLPPPPVVATVLHDGGASPHSLNETPATYITPPPKVRSK